MALALIRNWWPAALWAAIMFYASTDTFSAENTSSSLAPFLQWLVPGITSEQQQAVNFLVRKFAHFAEYAILYPLVLRGVNAGRTDWSWRRAVGAWCIVAAYSGLDEFHQSFVPSRTASLWDSALDSTGGLAAMLAVFLALRYRPGHRATSDP